MISKKTIAAGLIALSSLAAVPASASSLTIEFNAPGYGSGYGHKWDNYDHRDRGYRHGRYRLSREEIRWILNSRGYHDIRFFDDRGRVYQLRARRHGEAFYMAVSARSGEILSRYRI